MRTFRGLAAFAVGLAVAFLGAPSASASDTFHGTFAGGTGINSGGHGISAGQHELDLRGTWNVNVGANGVQVTGNLMTATHLQDCTLMPCPFGLNLQAGTPWVQTAPGVYTSLLDTGLVQFNMTINVNPGAPYVLSMTITGCPYGWQTWNIPGEARAG